MFFMAARALYEFDGDGIERIIVVGDLHGDYGALRSLGKIALDERSRLVFLGDYTDRGAQGVEVIERVGELLGQPNIVALKGNHEDYRGSAPTFSPCTFIGEVERKRGDWAMYFRKEFKPFVDKLHLAAMLAGKALFVHGGVSGRIKSVRDLRNPSRSVETDVLWSDPCAAPGERPSSRGAGVEFGSDVTERVCNALGVKIIIRSHEPAKAAHGPVYEHAGRVITTSATSVYGGRPFALVVNVRNLSMRPVFLKRSRAPKPFIGERDVLGHYLEA